MLDIYTWSVFIAGICFVSFGLFAYFNNRNLLSNRIFGLFSASFAIWCFSWFLTLIFKNDYPKALFFARLLNLGATLMPVLYLHWIVSVVGFNPFRKKFLIFAYSITAILILFSFSPIYIKGLILIYSFPVWPSAGSFYIMQIIFGYLLCVGYAVILLIKGIKQETGETRYQYNYLLLGTLLGFGGGGTNFPLMFNYSNIPYGEYFVLFGILGVMSSAFIFSYAAVKYRLLDVKLLSAEVFIGIVSLSFIVNLIVADSAGKRLVALALLFVVAIFSSLIVRGYLREVSQREKIEKLAIDLERSNTELEVANERLKELDRQKTEFVSIASHQLRSPLTAIKGYSSMLLEGSFGKLASKPREAVQVVFESSQKLVGVIEDFLNITRIELGKMKYEMSIIDMGKMVESVVNELKPNVMRRGLTMTFSGAEGPYNILADSGKLNQVFLNVIDNAVKYTPKGSIAIKIERRQEGDKKMIRFSSKDTGVGMDQATLPKLFEKFVRASGAGEINITGTGLGLYVAKQIVEAHGGKIWAESEGKGQGSTFIMEMTETKPLAEQKKEAEVKTFAGEL